MHPVCPGVVQAVITLQESWNRAVHEETRLFIALFWCKKVPFLFLYHNTGRACHEKYWKYSKEQLRDVFSTTEQGLSEMQVKEIRETCGENILEEGKRPGLLRVFLSQFADLLIVILLIAALISMFSGNAESTIVIAVVLVMNAVLGTVQHQKAENHWTV